jgi:hypothetical protein
MGLEYVNRRGERYYLLQGKTKSGKPKYYVSRKADGTAVERMPDGYEFHESPERGIVSVRKIRPTRLLPQEREQLATWIRELAGIEHFLVDVQDDSLVVYTPGNSPSESARLVDKLFGGSAKDSAHTVAWISQHAHYMPMFRFKVVEADKRHFSVERWCYLGSIDDWFYLAGAQPLQAQACKYLPYLNEESFYDLM